jgi:hypothetical protein
MTNIEDNVDLKAHEFENWMKALDTNPKYVDQLVKALKKNKEYSENKNYSNKNYIGKAK